MSRQARRVLTGLSRQLGWPRNPGGSTAGSSKESSAATLAATGPVPALGHRFAHAHQPRNEVTWPLTALSDRRPIIEQTRSDVCRKNLRNEGSSKNLERKVSLRRAGELRNVAVNLPEELDRSLVSSDDGVPYNHNVMETPVINGWKGNNHSSSERNSSNAVELALGPSASVESTEPASTPFLERQQEVHLLVPNTPPEDVLVVNTVDHARQVAARMMSSEFSGRVFACDTEVAEIDVTSQSPCCHGRLICFSVHAGPDVDLSTDGSRRPTLWVDTYLDGDPDRQNEARQILEAFTPFFASPHRPKVWHNFSFDRHVVERAGLRHDGFEADTMHMARLLDSSRKGKLSYSLESLSTDESIMHVVSRDNNSRSPSENCGVQHPASSNGSLALFKIGMKELFARPNLKADGTPGKLLVMDPVEMLQSDEGSRWRWVRYAATDARATWELYAALKYHLTSITDVALDAAVAREYAAAGTQIESMWDVYRAYWRPFGALLTEMEALGVAVDRARLAEAQRRAESDQEAARERFRAWAIKRVPDAEHMNVSSSAQVGQLLFAGVPNGKDATGSKPGVPLTREFKVPNVHNIVTEPGKKPRKNLNIKLHGLWGDGVPSPLKPAVFTPSGLPGCNTAVLKALAGPTGRAAKALAERYELERAESAAAIGLADLIADDDGDQEESDGSSPPDSETADSSSSGSGTTTTQVPSSSSSPLLLQVESAELEKIRAARGYGTLFPMFGTEEEGLRACAAVDALVDVGAVDTLLSNFIVPLQQDAIAKPSEINWMSLDRGHETLGLAREDDNGIQGGNNDGGEPLFKSSIGDPTMTQTDNSQTSSETTPSSSATYRVHCSLNINTETGRLSARRPNLQNQPALEKDRYGVRKAFTADLEAGHTLVVADYGQLELRILAHVAGCASMVAAFEAGGDFHSRTALGMYDHVREAVERGDCLLEWDGGLDGAQPPPAPLLKDLFSSERRRAKVLNFSIAYGKTAHGLARDWGVPVEEARETVERWYADRPEVRAWQEEQHALAQSRGYVCTLLGRRRALPDARSRNGAQRAHALRAAINTPIQGSAADVAAAAMLRIARDPRLAELGWALLLQVHDEVILEGPRETAEEARERVVACMRSPFTGKTDRPLLVDLVVDAKYADTWYDAK